MQKHEIESKLRDIEYKLSQLASISELRDLKSKIAHLETELQNIKNSNSNFAHRLREAVNEI